MPSPLPFSLPSSRRERLDLPPNEERKYVCNGPFVWLVAQKLRMTRPPREASFEEHRGWGRAVLAVAAVLREANKWEAADFAKQLGMTEDELRTVEDEVGWLLEKVIAGAPSEGR